MTKHINVNPNFYKVGGREHSEGPQKAVVTNTKRAPKIQAKKK
jgi:hypothetical protein